MTLQNMFTTLTFFVFQHLAPSKATLVVVHSAEIYLELD